MGRAWRDGVVDLAAQQRDGPLRVETAQFLTPHLFQPRTSLFPDLHPPPSYGDLFRGPTRETRIIHHLIIGPLRAVDGQATGP